MNLARSSIRRFAVPMLVASLIAAFVAAPALGSVPGTARANLDRVVTDEDTVVRFNPLDNDTADLRRDSVTVTGAPSHGTATASTQTGLITYAPAAHYNGFDLFAYAACTSGGTCVSAGVQVTVAIQGPYKVVIERDGFAGSQNTGVTKALDVSGAGEDFLRGRTITGSWPAVSPDGTKVATVYGGLITITDLNDGSTQNATAPAPPRHLSWSPGSDSLVFGTDDPGGVGPIYRVTNTTVDPLLETSADGSQVVVYGSSPAWGDSGIIFADHLDPDTDTVEHGVFEWASEAVFPLHRTSTSSLWTDASRDGHIVFVVFEPGAGCPGTTGGSFQLETLDSGGQVHFLDTACGDLNLRDLAFENPRFSPDGTKIAYGDTNIFAINTDGSNRTEVATQDHGPIGQGVAIRPTWDTIRRAAAPGPWTRPGHLVATAVDAAQGCGEEGTVRRLNANGSGATDFLSTTQGLFRAGTQSAPHWSPDGRRLVFSAWTVPPAGGTSLQTLFVVNDDGTGLTQLENRAGGRIDGLFYDPSWSPDGSRLVARVRPVTNAGTFGPEQLWTMNPDGTNTFVVSTRSGARPSWSPDGTWITFGEMWMIHPDGTGLQQMTVSSPYSPNIEPAWSPSGTQIAFTSGYRLMVGDFVATPAPYVLNVRFIGPLVGGSGSDDREPVWSPDGRAIGFTHGPCDAAELWVVNSDGSGNTRISDAFDTVHMAAPHWAPGEPTPMAQSMNPTTGPTAGGTNVTITGVNFGGPGTSVTFGGVEGTVTGGSATTLSVTTPQHPAGQVLVEVVNPDGQSSTLPTGFIFRDGLSIDRVTPSSGPSIGGTTVTIEGSGFGGPGTTATFGGANAEVTSGSATSLTVVTPAHPGGAVDVEVRNPDGQVATLPNGFTYVAVAPRIDRVQPNTGVPDGGTAVTIFGANFGGLGTTLEFGGERAIISGGNDTTLHVFTPPHGPGVVDVLVTNPDGSSAFKVKAYTYASLFVVADPPSGAPGSSVSVSGDGFQPGETVNTKYKTGLPHPKSIPLCRAIADNNGEFACAATIPTSNEGQAGDHVIVAKGLSSLLKAKNTFTLS
jgi:Tol biopolymer transport system component